MKKPVLVLTDYTNMALKVMHHAVIIVPGSVWENKEQEVFAQGYDKQTLHYAGSFGADLISVISTPSDDYYYFAAADKEALLLNDLHLPVLCTG